MGRFLPSGLRLGRARKTLIADAQRAALRNVGNLDWSLRQNIEESMRRLETGLGHRLMALDTRAAPAPLTGAPAC